MKSFRCVCMFVLFAILALTPSAFAQKSIEGAVGSERTFHWQGKLAADQTVAVKNITGNINAQPAAGDQLEITATKSGMDADEVKVVLIQNSEGVTVCALFPTGIEGTQNSCDSGRHSHSNSNGRHAAQVDFKLLVPRNLRFYAANVNGDVRAEGLGRHAEVASVNGGVYVSTSDVAEASTVNGEVEARMGKSDWDGVLKFSSVNGSITLEMPASLNANFDFAALNGDMQTDFPITMKSEHRNRFGPGVKISGQIGSGGHQLEVKTVNGSLELHRATM